MDERREEISKLINSNKILLVDFDKNKEQIAKNNKALERMK